MLRRLFRTGNSVVLSLPREMLESLGLADGENVSLTLEREQHRLVITPAEKPLAAAGVDEEFARQVTEFIKQHRPALEDLAR
jgi:antitoxin component of MazEF toxin-antitoxin module